ncbi:hypothetical protein PSCICL_27830 [Pseudomonas cichorii]|nr:hypothetical protein PSCICL_27830 [Pseudomonas cichorii]
MESDKRGGVKSWFGTGPVYEFIRDRPVHSKDMYCLERRFANEFASTQVAAIEVGARLPATFVQAMHFHWQGDSRRGQARFYRPAITKTQAQKNRLNWPVSFTPSSATA